MNVMKIRFLQKKKNRRTYFYKSPIFRRIACIYNKNISYAKGGNDIMNIEERIRMVILLEKMRKQKEFSQRLGLENKSRLHGKIMNQMEGKEDC